MVVFQEDQDAFLGRTTTAYIHIRGSFKAPPEYLSTSSVNSSNPTIAILVFVTSSYTYYSGLLIHLSVTHYLLPM